MQGTGLPRHRQGLVTGWGVRLFFPAELSCSLTIPSARGAEGKEMCTHTAVPRADPQQKKRAFFFFLKHKQPASGLVCLAMLRKTLLLPLLEESRQKYSLPLLHLH